MYDSYQAIVVGTSAGGFNASQALLSGLAADLNAAVIVVQHLPNQANDSMISLLNEVSQLPVKEAEEKEPIRPGIVYLCPPDYHLLIEADRSFALSAEPKVNYSRPSIDVLFESAAEVYRTRLVGVVLTGANADGSAGLKIIKQYGGLAIVQDPGDAAYAEMPQAALDAVEVDTILPLAKIAGKLNSLISATGKDHE